MKTTFKTMEKENQITRALDPQETLRLQMAKLKLRYAHLTDQDVSFDYGKKEVMMTALQAKLGKTREELNTILQQILL